MLGLFHPWLRIVHEAGAYNCQRNYAVKDAIVVQKVVEYSHSNLT